MCRNSNFKKTKSNTVKKYELNFLRRAQFPVPKISEQDCKNNCVLNKNFTFRICIDLEKWEIGKLYDSSRSCKESCFKFLNHVILVIDAKFVGFVIKICLQRFLFFDQVPCLV